MIEPHTVEAYQDEQADLWDTLAFCCKTIGEAIRDRDAIAGTLASEGLLENLKHLSPELKQMLTDALAGVPHGR